MRSPLALAAADYLNMGLPVIALTGKTPNVKVHRRGLTEPIRGPVETEADWQLVEGVFDHKDTTGIGIVILYPYVVVDIDGLDGAEQWRDLVGFENIITAKWAARTGRGLHLWYSNVEPTGSIKLGSKLDLKGQNSYVAAPPSRHPDGPIYEWLIAPGAEAPYEAPEPLARRIHLHNRDRERAMVGRRTHTVIRKPRCVEGDTVFYAQTGYQSLIESVKGAEEGNRNNMLHWAAATLDEEGGIEEDFVELQDAAIAAGLEPEEVRRTLRSARRG